MENKRYHIHSLYSFNKFTYQYLGSYKYKWMAKIRAFLFIVNNEYGTACITNSKEEPEYKEGL